MPLSPDERARLGKMPYGRDTLFLSGRGILLGSADPKRRSAPPVRSLKEEIAALPDFLRQQILQEVLGETTSNQ